MYFIQQLFPTLFGCAIAGSGLFMTLYLRFYPQRNIFHALKVFFSGSISAVRSNPNTRKKDDGISSFAASASALAGTLGTGNIAGVAAALVSGGPGAIFWMWIGAFLGMSLKYAEIFLSVRFRKGNPPDCYPDYIEKAFPAGKGTAVFAIGCIGASLGVGNLAQVNAAADAVQMAFHFPLAFTGMILALGVAFVLIGGKKRIAAAAEKVIPLVGAAYFLVAFLVIFLRIRYLPEVIRLIFIDALNSNAVRGGFFGILTSRAFRSGITRGVFTNEAGLGSASIVHSASSGTSPSEEGLWGVAEVTLDTLIMCTLTAAVILLTAPHPGSLDSVRLTAFAFSSVLGDWTEYFLAVASILFAFSSLLTWEWCGESAVFMLGGQQKSIFFYRIFFIGCVLFGSILPVHIVLSISDLLNFYMCLPNILSILRFRRFVSERPMKKP